MQYKGYLVLKIMPVLLNQTFAESTDIHIITCWFKIVKLANAIMLAFYISLICWVMTLMTRYWMSGIRCVVYHFSYAPCKSTFDDWERYSIAATELLLSHHIAVIQKYCNYLEKVMWIAKWLTTKVENFNLCCTFLITELGYYELSVIWIFTK